tara:strand:- start:59213 stop:59347 length:135 start_codon:yes stop_codon:yes gene_type:complete
MDGRAKLSFATLSGALPIIKSVLSQRPQTTKKRRDKGELEKAEG